MRGAAHADGALLAFCESVIRETQENAERERGISEARPSRDVARGGGDAPAFPDARIANEEELVGRSMELRVGDEVLS